MIDSFIASTCLHPTDSTTSVLPFSDSPIDFATPLCRNCQLQQEDADAEAELMSLVASFKGRPTVQMRKKVREARRRYTQKHLEVVRERQKLEEKEGVVRGRVVREGREGREECGVEVVREGRRVSWREGIEEREKRRQGEFTRGNVEYVPGRWADGSGEGFWNTSDPFKEETKEDIWEADEVEAEAETMEMVKVEEIVIDPQLLAENAADGDSELAGITYERLRAEAEEIERKIARLKGER